MPPTIHIGCTNPSSYGLINDFVMATPTLLGNAGSPMGVNGEALCKENCMQLQESYYTDFAIYGAGTVPNLTGTFNRNNIYDCEGPQNIPESSAPVSGPKLIYVGGSSQGTVGYFLKEIGVTECNGHVNVEWNLQTGAEGEVEIPENSGIFYSVTETNWMGRFSVPPNEWVGYLHSSWNVTNDFGRLDNSVVDNTNPHLWRRKSKFKIMGQTVSMDDADACCTYVSFGCTDPNFGSYNPKAQLDCAGKSVTNAYTTNNSGALECRDPNGTPVTLGGNNDYCYGENGLDCSLCINPTTLLYDINQPDCTLPILKACGGNPVPGQASPIGYVDPGAWAQMVNQTYGGSANSPLYGDAQIWDKGGRAYGVQWAQPVYGNWPSAELPICQCNNVGCLNPVADNYSPLNTLDCNGDAPTGPLDYGQQFCCQISKEGCPDPNKITPPTANYFCVVDVDGNNVPDNQQWCMDPNTGTPCDQTSCGPSGGVPLSPGSPVIFPDNPLVTVVDNGTCDMTLIPGCLDDGGATWPSPIFPGYAAMNFDPLATIHIQSLCEYVRACPDTSALNSGKACDGTDFTDLATYYGQTLAYIFDNAIPDATCCDFNLPGSGIGCMDPTALNYNPLATSPGSCNYAIEGCTDSNALNYDPLATIEDGSCIYATDFPEEGDNFLDGTPVQLCREPLTKEEVLMNVCQPTEIQSEVFIERGKQTVFEPNQRLGEVNTIGGLEIYGYGFYNIKTQI
jgi:hypothetical protein